MGLEQEEGLNNCILKFVRALYMYLRKKLQIDQSVPMLSNTMCYSIPHLQLKVNTLEIIAAYFIVS